MSRRLDGKVALITGTGGGQGRAAAIRFAQEGALVVGCDLFEEGNQETVEAVKEAGGVMTGMAPVNLSDPQVAQAWVEEAAAVHGRIDVLYNNASSPKFVPMPDLSVEDWQYTIHNELDLVFYVTKFAWPYLAQRGGVIINTASTSAHVATAGVGMAAHCAAKGGVLALTRVFAADGGAHGIRAVSISPGAIKTPGSIKEFFHIPGAEEAVIGQLLTNRVGLPEDIAALAAFVASDEASFMTGVDVLMDGGLTAL
ncbi:SDR family oxidoreductase [Streptomyces prunicolor]|uniref:SDR family NAD(P)-dependent oxidoreductase n=1 Tax=Streptomyces prunicolor TaxID=67348 RepID=UPI0038641C29|nr:SDR family oxidoreductase [Streptomyces prunicolor]